MKVCVSEARFFWFESWCVGSNPAEVDFFFYICVLCEAHFWGSNPGEVNFFPLHPFPPFFLADSIEGCCLCCSINFYSWDAFFACMAVRQLLRNGRAIVTFSSC